MNALHTVSDLARELGIAKHLQGGRAQAPGQVARQPIAERREMSLPDFADLAKGTCAVLLAGKLRGEFEMAREVGEREDPSGFQRPFKAFAHQAQAELVGVRSCSAP